jgi:hypothetical protein
MPAGPKGQKRPAEAPRRCERPCRHDSQERYGRDGGESSAVDSRLAVGTKYEHADRRRPPPTAADRRKLADRLSQRQTSGARLTPESATLAMVALRVYADLLEQPSIETLGQPYEVAVIDADEHKTEILAVCRNVIVAKAAFLAAVEQRAGKRLKLTRGAQVYADSGEGR